MYIKQQRHTNFLKCTHLYFLDKNAWYPQVWAFSYDFSLVNKSAWKTFCWPKY